MAIAVLSACSGQLTEYNSGCPISANWSCSEHQGVGAASSLPCDLETLRMVDSCIAEGNFEEALRGVDFARLCQADPAVVAERYRTIADKMIKGGSLSEAFILLQRVLDRVFA